MPVDTTQVTYVELTDTFTQFKDKVNDLIRQINGLPAFDFGTPVSRSGGTIDGNDKAHGPPAGVDHPTSPNGDQGVLYLIDKSSLAVGDFLGINQPETPNSNVHLHSASSNSNFFATTNTATGVSGVVFGVANEYL